jgi:hypothetical protein
MAGRRAEAAFDAVKIRCRNRRTSASARRQSIWRHRSASSSGPLTATVVVASSLSFGSGISVIFLFTGSPDRVSTLSGPGTRPDIRPVMRDRQLEGWLPGPGFPSRFRCRRSLLGHPIPAEGLGSPHGRLTGRDLPPGPRRGYHVPHARAATGVGAPYTPRTAVLARSGRLPDRHPPLPSGQSLNPATTSHHARLSFTGHQQGFTHVHPSGLPLARVPGMEPAALRLPPSFAPHRHRQRTSRAGTGHRARTWNYRSTHIRRSPIR